MKLNQFISNLEPIFKKNLYFIFFSYFTILFSYPLIRSATSTLYIEYFKVKNMPLVWFVAIVLLVFVVMGANKLQHRFGVHRVFTVISLISVCIFTLGPIIYDLGFGSISMFLAIWKEIYIVLLIHLLLGYCNSFFKIEQVKTLYGAIGAAGSIGGILGGLLTSFIANSFGTNYVLYVGAIGIFIGLFAFSKTIASEKLIIEEKFKKNEPLRSIGDVKKYVFLIAGIVALSQFVINIADLKFHLVFEQLIANKDARTAFQGKVYTSVNAITLVIQFLILPFLMTHVSNKKLHYFIPLFYVGINFFGIGLGANMLFLVASVFVLLKATDYSIFSVAKEILYHPLSADQKYGAKYITDMLTYRVAKAVIAVVLIYFQSMFFLNTMLAVFCALWLLSVMYLFKCQKEL